MEQTSWQAAPVQRQVDDGEVEDEGSVTVVSRGHAMGATLALVNPVSPAPLQAAVVAASVPGSGNLHCLPAAALELPGSFLHDTVFIDVITNASSVRASCMLGNAAFPKFDCLAQIYQGNVDPPEQPVRAYVTPMGTPKAIAFGSSFDAIASNWTVWHDLSSSTTDRSGHSRGHAVAFAVSKQLVPDGGTATGVIPRPFVLAGRRPVS